MKSTIGKLLRKLIWFFKKRKNKLKISFSSNISLNSNFEGYNSIGKRTTLYNCNLGKYSYIGQDCNIINTVIGKFCSIGNKVEVVVATHPTKKFVSTHPMFFSTKRQNGYTFVKKDCFEEIIFYDKKKNLSVLIGNDVWIGNDVTIKGGVKIGDGAIIGAKSLILHDVEPYSIYAGIPAKKIRDRFDQKQIDVLLDMKWWNWNEKKLKNKAFLFNDIVNLMEDIKR